MAMPAFYALPSAIRREPARCRLGVARWVGKTCRQKTFLAQTAGIAHATGATCRIRLIAGDSYRVIDSQARALANDIGLAHFDDRGADSDFAAPHAGFGGKARHPLEGREIFRPAITVNR